MVGAEHEQYSPNFPWDFNSAKVIHDEPKNGGRDLLREGIRRMIGFKSRGLIRIQLCCIK